jgi:hypothetical protein
MSTNNTQNQTAQLSEIRDHVIVSEVPVINIDIKIITNTRKIDATKLGLNSELIKTLPESILAKLEVGLVPSKATRPLEAKRKQAEKLLKSRAVYNKLFGWIAGHEDAIDLENGLSVIQSSFYSALMSEEEYNQKTSQIIEEFAKDPILLNSEWHSTFIEIAKMRQPCWGEYIAACSFDLAGNYIGEAGTISGNKMRSSKDSFDKIFTSTKGVLIKEIADFASTQLVKAYAARSKDHGVKEVTWKLAYALCDKLKGLSFVSPNIAKAESEIRSKFIQALPDVGSIYGITRDNYISIISALSDPFRLADKIDSGLPLFKVDDSNLDMNSDETLALNYNETETNEDVYEVTEIELIPVMEVEEIIEASSEELAEEETIETLEALLEKEPKTANSADDFISQSAEVVNSVSDFSGLSHDDLMRSLGF